MARKRPARTGNPDLRQQKQVPMPPIEEIEQKIYSLLSPLNFKPLKLYETEEKKPFRDRILTLSVMMALVVSLVYRQIPGLREVQRVLCEEGLLWAGRIEVSAQAVSKRLRTLPIELFAQIFEQVMERMNVKPQNQAVPENWQPVCAKFTAIWITDGSTLEALRRKLKVLQEQDLGFFKFPWFDAFTEADKFFLTRLREKTSYKVIRCLTNASFYRNEIISMGEYRSNPCQHQVRLVSVLWGSTWYYYLTNVLDPQMLSAHLVCELGSRRWRVEDAFLLTKRLLGLAYIWVGDNNGVQIQIFATWIFYAVLNQLCIDIAIALNQPLDRISTEMVFRALYHFSQAVLRGDAHEAVPYLVERQKLFGLVKAGRKRHREISMSQ